MLSIKYFCYFLTKFLGRVTEDGVTCKKIKTYWLSVDVKRKDLYGQACAEGRRGTLPQGVLVGRCDATGL